MKVLKRNGVDVDHRRLLGVYYTPDDLAEVLVEWALEHSPGTVLDPSFGGCAFLRAAAKVLRTKGVEDPGRLLYGVDIDPACATHVRGCTAFKPENFVFRDFLEVRLDCLGGVPFEAIVGNPPYVRHHWLKGPTRSAARALIESSAIHLPATASSWAYFILHALSFLRPGGRLAMLAPEAILQADYAIPIREALAAHFGRVSLIHVRDRLFDGTEEPIVVVACAGFGETGGFSIESVETAGDLVGVLSGAAAEERSSYSTVPNGRSVSPAVLEWFEVLKGSTSVRPFGDLARTRIGIVTGANAHFVRSASDLRKLRIPPEARVPVVSRTTWLSGLEFTAGDHLALVKANRRALLVRPTPALEQKDGTASWIAEGVDQGLDRRFKCAERSPWFRVELPPAPDAFATCTRLGSPLLVLDRPRYRCTNALYAVSWLPKLGIDPSAVAVGFLTSAVSVWAELHGRRYGGGVLKLDLGTLAKVPVPLVAAAAAAFDDIDSLLRRGDEAAARALADLVVLQQGLGGSEKDVRLLRQAQSELAAQRVPGKRRIPRDR